MRSQLLLLCGLGILISQSSCQQKTFDPALAGSFFPLKPGLTWTYRFIDNRYGNGTWTDRVLGTAHPQSRENGSEVVSRYSSPTGVLDSSIVYVPEHGYFTRRLIIRKNDWITSEDAFLPQLLKPDLVWSSSLIPFGEQGGTFQVAQTHRSFFDSRTIEVPAGRFTGCIRIETTARYESILKVNPPLQLKYFDWYAPNVGLIKTLVMQPGLFGSEVARIELMRFGSVQRDVVLAHPTAARAEPG